MQPSDELRAIRESMGFSVREMAAELGIKPPTYQGYDEGSRAVPDEVLAAARASKVLVDNFMAGLPARVDLHLVNGRCPNEVRA